MDGANTTQSNGIALPNFGTLRSLSQTRQVVYGGVAFAVVALVVAIVLIVNASSSSTPKRVVASGPAPADAYSAPAPSDGRNGTPFALVAGQPMFPMSPGRLDSLANAPVEMQSVKVEGLGGTGFWVGESADQRIYVIADVPQGAEPAPPPSVGTLVNVSGWIRAVPENSNAFGLTPELGAPQLGAQAYYLAANSVRVPSAP